MHKGWTFTLNFHEKSNMQNLIHSLIQIFVHKEWWNMMKPQIIQWRWFDVSTYCGWIFLSMCNETYMGRCVVCEILHSYISTLRILGKIRMNWTWTKLHTSIRMWLETVLIYIFCNSRNTTLTCWSNCGSPVLYWAPPDLLYKETSLIASVS